MDYEIKVTKKGPITRIENGSPYDMLIGETPQNYQRKMNDVILIPSKQFRMTQNDFDVCDMYFRFQNKTQVKK